MSKFRFFLLALARCAVVLAVVLLLRHPASAQGFGGGGSRPQRAKTANSKTWVLRTYEVGDLVFNVPDYPYSPSGATSSRFMHGMGMGMGGGMMNVADGRPGMGEMGGMGVGPMGPMGMPGGAPMGLGANRNRTSGAARITIQDLLKVVQTLVAPSTWGPEEGGVQQLGTALVVRQTPEVHKEIKALLAELRAESMNRRTVTVDARWLVLDSTDLKHLDAGSAKNGFRNLDRQALDEFTRRATSIRGVTNCFTGQLVYLVGGTRQNVVTGYIPVVGSVEKPEANPVRLASLTGGARITYAQHVQFEGGGMGRPMAGSATVGYQPVVEKPNFGTLLEIRPTLLSGLTHAVVDLRSTITVPGSPTSVVPPNMGGAQVPKVDRIAIETQQLATTLQMPLNQPVLVGGLTYVAPLRAGRQPRLRSHAAGAEATPSGITKSHETPQLYLILELR